MNFRIIYLFLFAVSIVLPGCGKEPVFTEMSTNRLTIRIKGTLESENSGYIRPSVYPVNNAAAATAMKDDSVTVVSDSVSNANDISPSKIMIDIAEIRLGGKKISNYRQIITASLDDADNDPFFNGTGVEVKTDDPGEGNYDSVQLYIRKMIFDNALVYTSSSTGIVYDKPAEVIFHEETVEGFNFNALMVNSYWDSLRTESSEIIRIFPMQIPIVGGLSYNKENGETVLEVRLVIKNFIKKYEYEYYDEGVYKACHYYAPSDWLRDVRERETDIGRNLHGVARTYVPGQTGQVTVNASAGYVVAIPSTESIGYYGIASNGLTLRNAVGDADLPQPPNYYGSYMEPVLDYYLKLEKYKYEWNDQVTTSGLTFAQYTSAWDTYEEDVHGDPAGSYNFGLKIAPYVAYRNSAGNFIFSNMAPGEYMFYHLNTPAYGALFIDGDFSVLNGGVAVTVSAGDIISF